MINKMGRIFKTRKIIEKYDVIYNFCAKALIMEIY